MNLSASITEVLEVTAKLRASLAAGDLQGSVTLVERRGQALETFALLHRNATQADKSACASLLAELKRTDTEIQKVSVTARDTISQDWNRSLGQSHTPRHEYDRAPDIACLDRKA